MAADKCLKDLKKDVFTFFDTLSQEVEVQILEILIDQSKSLQEQTKFTAFEWILMFLQKYKYHSLQNSKKIRSPYTKSVILNKTSNNATRTLGQPFTSKESSMTQFSQISYDPSIFDENATNSNLTTDYCDMKIPFHLLPKILEVIIWSVNHPNTDIKQMANDCNNELIVILDFYCDSHNHNIKLFEETLRQFFHEERETTLELVLLWINKLFKKFHEEMFNKVEDFIENITSMISQTNDTLFNNIMDTICQIAKQREEYTELILISILKNLCANKNLLNNKGLIILKKLCTVLQVEKVYLIFADVLLHMKVIKQSYT